MLTSNPAQASIFKCVNQQGSVYYNDKPCPEKDKETQLKAIKDPKNGYIPKPFKEVIEEDGAIKGVVVGKESLKKVDSKNNQKDSKKEKQASDVSGNNKSKTLNNNQKSKGFPIPPASFSMGSEVRIPTVHELRALSGNSRSKDNAGSDSSWNTDE